MNTTLLPAFMCNIASRVVWLRQAIEQDPELKKVAHKLARFTAPMSFEKELLSGKMDQVQKVVDETTEKAGTLKCLCGEVQNRKDCPIHCEEERGR